MQVLSSELSLGAKNHYVHMFKQLVYYSLGLNYLIKSYVQNKLQSRVLPAKHIAEFDKDLYNKAISLPEANTVSLKTISSDAINPSKYQYGRFTGGTVYSTLDGEIDVYNKHAKSQVGWIILDLSSNEYCLFRNENSSFIIAIKDFIPEPIIEDFMPLFDKLNEQIRHPGLYLDVLNDLFNLGSLSVSFRAAIAPMITANLDINTSLSINPFAEISAAALADISVAQFNDSIIKNSLDRIKKDSSGNITEKWEIEDPTYGKSYDNPWTGVEAIIYALPNGKEMDSTNGKYASSSNSIILKCFQTPDSISYTAQANFESQSPRGSQQPFQFYQGASAMSISFTLEWHISEIYRNPDPSQRTLQSIAEIAESFTRPWNSSNGSIKPKLCKVILPSISEVGYITQAQIEYSGDMIGSNEGVVSQNSFNDEDYTMTTIGSEVKPTEYGYDKIKVNFDLLIVKDVKLFSEDSKSAIIASHALSLQSTEMGEIFFGDARLSEDSTQIEFIYKDEVVNSVENPSINSISANAIQQSSIQETMSQPVQSGYEDNDKLMSVSDIVEKNSSNIEKNSSNIDDTFSPIIS